MKRKTVLLICLLIGNYWGLLFGKMLIGAGMGIIYVGCNTVSATGGTDEKVATAFAGVSAGTLSGLTIGAGLSSVLLSMGGWHLIYLAGSVIIGLGLILAATSGNVVPQKADPKLQKEGSVRLREFLVDRHVIGFFLLVLLPFMMAGMAVAFALRLLTVSDSHLIQLVVKSTMFAVVFSAVVYAMIERRDRDFFLWFVKVKLLRKPEA